MDSNRVKSFATHCPPLDELAQVLQDGLKSYFHEVDVKVAESPDFTKAPYKIAVNGFHGKPSIADVGGVHNLIPHVNLESGYDLTYVTKSIYKSGLDYPISIFGPGGGAFQALGYCAEFIGSARYASCEDGPKMIGCACRYAFVDEEGKGHWREETNDDRFGLMGNFYLSQNKQGKVLKIIVKQRLGKENYTESIRAVLLARYGQEKPISMGGIFLINNGTAKLHIMPKYWPEEPSTDESVNNEWLKFYKVEMNHDKLPLVCLSIVHSHDPGYKLRMEHTHCFNLETQTEAGHYHYDLTPETIEYEGYFNPAERVFRLDGPVHKK